MPGYDANRPWRHLYGVMWRKQSKRFLNRNPLCVLHRAKGEIVAASIVDHITPHKGDPKLFWDQTNWQALCKCCHDGYKQRLERAPATCKADGYPSKPDAW